MARLIILRGNSGSGKTTVAKALQKRLGRNTMLISQDVVRRDMLQVKDGPDSEAIPLMGELLKYGRSHSDVVILEGIMYAEWYRPVFELAIRLYEKVDAYYFDLPFEETLRRHQTKPNCKEFGEVEIADGGARRTFRIFWARCGSVQKKIWRASWKIFAGQTKKRIPSYNEQDTVLSCLFC